MTDPTAPLLDDQTSHTSDERVQGEYVERLGEEFYCIRGFDRMPPFFMSVVSASDHWMFISSTGGLTAGRANAESALFPYYTEDKVTENHSNTGPLSVLKITRDGKTALWEPFSDRLASNNRVIRNLYKSVIGSTLIFEEVNLDLSLTFAYAWQSSEKHGFVRTCWLASHGEACEVSLIDGLQNLVPYGVSSQTQNVFGNLLNAYKRSELQPSSGLGLFSLSSLLTDLPEPSESLMTTTVWQMGLQADAHLLSVKQVEAFRSHGKITPETDICGQRGAYLVNSSFVLEPGSVREWRIVAEVNQDSSSVASLVRTLTESPEDLLADLQSDIRKGSADLTAIIGSSDGLQGSGDRLGSAHHFANVLFNVMRGGIFAEGYLVSRDDLTDFIQTRNRGVFSAYKEFIAGLPEKIAYQDLLEQAASVSAPRQEESSGAAPSDLLRLCYEYLPLTFSRRHGDPSRPWNQFSINIKKEDGSKRLDYQGNWRDIFQNWEPLAWSYPHFVEGMLAKFVNATTLDGYNPYRVTRDGIDWEVPEPGNPWANIGYWSDHQIIYLQKLLEVSHRVHPGKLQSLLNQAIFSIANVPYRIKPYASLVEDPAQTISFDWESQHEIEARVHKMGSDGRLVLDSSRRVVHVTLAEKLIVLLLAKLTNLVPEGGIWMNTQRPEWNDANNALVGKGLSVVTLGYLRRALAFLKELLTETGEAEFEVSDEVSGWFSAMHSVLQKHAAKLAHGFDDAARLTFLNEAGEAGSACRWNCYEKGLSGSRSRLAKSDLLPFLDLAQKYVEQSLRANLRNDKLYHSYNILHLSAGKAAIGHLDEMLEGQVSILSSGILTTSESLDLLRSLRKSRMYRADQHSYMLYPARTPAGFLAKNQVDASLVSEIPLAAKLIQAGNGSLITRDIRGVCHFNGRIRNAKDVKGILAQLASSGWAELVEQDGPKILALFEKVFNHSAFTGRSGSFFAYEGIGSIYWHMVTKLLLAVQEVCFRADAASAPELAEIYFDVRSGLGYHKSPEVYGAFPTDPYSHTPAGQGAKQPGMTGQVKEEILTRLGELGLSVEGGVISFRPTLLRTEELTQEPSPFRCVSGSGAAKVIEIPPGALAFTYCQTPIIYRTDGEPGIQIFFSDGSSSRDAGSSLDHEASRRLFDRDGTIERIEVGVKM